MFLLRTFVLLSILIPRLAFPITPQTLTEIIEIDFPRTPIGKEDYAPKIICEFENDGDLTIPTRCYLEYNCPLGAICPYSAG